MLLQKKKQKKSQGNPNNKRWAIRTLTSMTAVFCMIMGISPVYAWEGRDPVMDSGWLGTITVHYGTDTEGDLSFIPKGAEFDFYKIADIDTTVGQPETDSGMEETAHVALSYHSLIHGIEVTEKTTADDVTAFTLEQYREGTVENGRSYQGTIDDYGTCTVTGVETGKYLAIEKENNTASTHLPCDPFLVSVPESTTENGADVSTGWDYDVDVYPKVIPLGNIEIKKRTEGNAAESDRDFHFVIRLSEPSSTIHSSGDGEIIHENLYTCRWNTGEESTIGNDSVIKLKSGQSATISGIPAGTEYRVIEKEANKDGYETVFENAKGNVNPAETTSVLCRNIRNQDKRSGTLDTADNNHTVCVATALIATISVVGIQLVILGRRKKHGTQ